MMALRKMISALTVLMMLTSGMTLTAFAAAPAPAGETDGSAPPSDATADDSTAPTDDATATDDAALMDAIASKVVTERTTVLSLKDGYKDLSTDPLLSTLPMGVDGVGKLIHREAVNRAPASVLLIDDDDSDASNTTSDFDNGGVYKRDTAHFMDDALTNLFIDHDLFLVPRIEVPEYLEEQQKVDEDVDAEERKGDWLSMLRP